MTALSNITNLKKLCNHPDLVYDKIEARTDGFEHAHKHMPVNYSKKYGSLRMLRAKMFGLHAFVLSYTIIIEICVRTWEAKSYCWMLY